MDPRNPEEVLVMCDYSAKSTKQRAATKDDRLVSSSISEHTRGFVSAIDPSTAVCLVPGTQLAFEKPVEVDGVRLFGLVKTARVVKGYQVATFIQVEKGNSGTHHDALEFPDGSVVKLNVLVVGQRAKVLQLPAVPRTAAEQEEQTRAAYV